MRATLTSKGQITIPRAIRERLHLRPGDVLEFDENATILKAHRVIESDEWERRLESAREKWKEPLWGSEAQTAEEILRDTRGPVELPDET